MKIPDTTNSKQHSKFKGAKKLTKEERERDEFT